MVVHELSIAAIPISLLVLAGVGLINGQILQRLDYPSAYTWNQG